MKSAEAQRAEPPSRTVVVGFDGSDLARAALVFARLRAGPRGRLIAVYAATLAPEVVMGLPPPPVEPHEEIGERILGTIEGADGATETRQAIGPPARALVGVAQEEDADEIVVGSHGAGRLRALLGSTSHALVHDADRPVAVLTERAARHAAGHAAGAGGRAHLIVLGYDGSEHAKAALTYARRHLAPGGEIVAVHAYRAPPEWKGTPYYNADLEVRLERGRHLLEEVEHPPEVSVELIPGAPATALANLATARGADEIVVGSRGHSTLRAALGSVAHAILHEADRPVVIVPRPAATA